MLIMLWDGRARRRDVGSEIARARARVVRE